MRMSKFLLPTLREDPADADIISHKFLLRGGYIRKVAAGIYDFLPLGLRVLNKVANIVRDEMNNAGAQEVLLPAAIPAELWRQSERWDIYGKELLRFKDRKEADFCIGPTHEEVITDLVRQTIKSYKQLPLNLYQIQTKFRDEIRPRFGLMRGREFLMKDAYSFHDSAESLSAEYKNMYDTYTRIFKRCGLNFKVDQADPGNIGGSVSHEFMVLANSGEDILMSCNSCDYAANLEIAACLSAQAEPSPKQGPALAEVKTPNQKTIEEVASFLKVKPEQMIKTLIYRADDKFAAVLIRGDYDINEVKLKKALNCNDLILAVDEEIEKTTGAPLGFAGPCGLKINLVVDHSVLTVEDGVTGANKKDYHLSHVVPGRDFKFKETVDLRFAQEGDVCSHCKKGRLHLLRGIEVGHIFKLGTKYSKTMKAKYLDEKGSQQPFIMGCYGIGVSRTMAAAVEQLYDEHGPVWPLSLAPFHFIVVPADMTKKDQVKFAEKIYKNLLDAKQEVIFDDRNERLGVKLKDADLMGIPYKIIIGKLFANNKFEIKFRRDNKIKEVDCPEADKALSKLIIKNE